jgi:lantibiotic biosynthesis protein
VIRDWSPIVDGSKAAELRAIVDDIARELSTFEPEVPGLLGGAAGIALFFAYLGQVTGDDHPFEQATSLMERASSMIAEMPIGTSLSTGVSGIGWAIEHLAGDPDAETDVNAAIDRSLADTLANGWDGQYDFVGGLVGVAVYALARTARPGARELLARIVTELDGRIGTDGSVHTPAADLPPWQREVAPNGYINLGVAHGLPGIIAVLAQSVAANVAAGRARELVVRCVGALRRYRIEHAAGHYPSWISGASSDTTPARMAWCYGDPGIACALLSAGRLLGEPSWEQEAIELAHGVARTAGTAWMRDAALCHGALGNALILDRFFHATGDDSFAEAARVYVDRALAMRRPGEPFAGYPAHHGVVEEWKADAGLLTGAAGVGLAILALTSDVEPMWDRLLLLP